MSDQVWSVRLSWPGSRYEETGSARIGPYFSLLSALNQASRARGKGATVLGIDTGTVEWQPTREPS